MAKHRLACLTGSTFIKSHVIQISLTLNTSQVEKVYFNVYLGFFCAKVYLFHEKHRC